MSKTFETNAQKALTMASGIKKHLSEVAHLGIKAEANEQLADVKELAMGYRQTIKNNFPPEKWEHFGIMDKR